MSTKSKGNLWERIAERVLLENFCSVVHTTERKMLQTSWGGWMSLSNDLFGCIDHLGVPTDPNDRMPWLVQTTTDSGIGRKAREIKMIKWPKGWHVEVWRGVGGKGGRKWDRRAGAGEIELQRWYFQRYRFENNFKMVQGDIIKITRDVLDKVFGDRKKKIPKCACGAKMKTALEQQIGHCAECHRKLVGNTDTNGSAVPGAQ